MTTAAAPRDEVLDFVLPPELEAHEPPEAAGRPRDDVRLLVSVGTEEPVDTRLGFLPTHLRPGDLLVVNTSATVPAALDGVRADGEAVAVHLSTPLPDGTWLLEVRRRVDGTTEPYGRTMAGEAIELPGGARLVVTAAWRSSTRLTVAELHLGGPLLPYLARWGHPIRYRHVPVPWPIGTYQTVFADRPGSAEMPSASRPFTADLVTRLVSSGVAIAPVTLHTGVSSLEEHEDPYPERFDVPASTAERVVDTHRHGGRVVALGTTAARALESALAPAPSAGGASAPVAASGWTERVISPAEPPALVDGLITGWHEPRSSHLRMLEAVAGRPALALAYERAVVAGYRWHEFGDLHLILRAP
ncbi:MAG TPA: S-adenosylmethionine:tRNA ribosyltransferase-isomerase [Aquihabitans sp.]|jgi:S-adenosylmethionine:tRNA ribosyltransferase-isomerase|nr:S-adenosylmethionine:tRNA ribosyltransferase-isomerase [Aquihabitans sp.]